MSGMPWTKSYVDLLANPRYGQLPNSARLHLREMQDLAGSLDAGGAFITADGELMSIGDIAYAIRADPKELEQDLPLLMAAKFIHLNGCGPEIRNFEERQGPSQQEKREAWKKRQQKLRAKANPPTVTGDTPTVTGEKGTESESESESDQSQRIESVSQDPQPATDDDRSMTDRKKEICSLSGIPPKYSQVIIKDPLITPDDILSELSRSYSRGTKVKNPGLITAMNLVKHEIHPEWNDPAQWTRHLPDALLQKLGLVIQGDENTSGNRSLVATRITSNEPRGEKVQKKVDAFLRGGR